MAENRKKIGILFSYSENWIGGSYYFINLIKALNTLDYIDKPHIVIVSNDPKSLEIMQTTEYPFLSFLNQNIKLNLFERVINKTSRLLFRKNIINKKFNEKTLPIIFGYYEQIESILCKRKIYWIPDFQDRYYPQYFESVVIKQRQSLHNKLAYSNKELVFSSNDSKNDFIKFYPSHNCQTYVLPFAVSNEKINRDFSSVRKKYKIETTQYFFSPNQFWPHKNHLTLIKAVEILKKKNIEIFVIFTGNESTYGGKYATSLKTYIINNNLEENFKFLGFINREDQLLLMKNSIAIIQPSLFEGWSTVVEDAKSLNKFIILSDLSVHKEQLKENACFFHANNPSVLSQSIEQFLSKGVIQHDLDYNKNIYEFAQKFSRIVNHS